MNLPQRQYTQQLAKGGRLTYETLDHVTVANYGAGKLWVTYNSIDPEPGESDCLLITPGLAYSVAATSGLPFIVKLVAEEATTVAVVTGMIGLFSRVA